MNKALLRTKGGDRDSCASGDEVNALDWLALREGSGGHETMRYYRGLIAMRRRRTPGASEGWKERSA